MRHAHLFLSAFVCAATPVLARHVPVPKPMPPNHVLHFDLSGVHFFHEPSAPPTGFTPWDQHASDSRALSLPKLGVGPLHAEFGVDDNPRANLSTYKMQGGDQLGSSIWPAERGKSAKLMFTWPTEK
ncbi:MAG TPA: hypothetical protein VHT03_03245 [Rhizomicrobium sp.]|jgi:hypothetical protein|nr:hypothetical protein [Rhizomicrobium sp.]